MKQLGPVAYCHNCGLERWIAEGQKLETCQKCGPRMRMDSARRRKIPWNECISEILALISKSRIRIRVRK